MKDFMVAAFAVACGCALAWLAWQFIDAVS